MPTMQRLAALLLLTLTASAAGGQAVRWRPAYTTAAGALVWDQAANSGEEMAISSAGALTVLGSVTAADFLCATPPCLSTTEMADSYVLNTTDTMSGDLVVASTIGIGTSGTAATSLQIGNDIATEKTPAQVHRLYAGWTGTVDSSPVGYVTVKQTASSASSAQALEGFAEVAHSSGAATLAMGTVGNCQVDHTSTATVGECRGGSFSSIVGASATGGAVTRSTAAFFSGGSLSGSSAPITSLIGVDVSLFKLGSGAITTAYGINVAALPTAGTKYSAYFTDGTVFLGTVPASGGTAAICWDGTGGSLIGTCSSRRALKRDIRALPGALAADLIDRLRPVRFEWRSTAAPALGFIAEEVAEVDDRLVTRDADGEPQSVETAPVVAALVATVQDLMAEVRALRQRVADLEALAADAF